MEVTQAYKVKLYPNATQGEELHQILDASRFVYNHFLAQRKNFYLENKKTLSYLVMSRQLTQLRKTEPALAGVQLEPLQQSLRRLDTAYNRFFRKHSSFPRFKSRFDDHQSFQKHQGWRVLDGRIQIQKNLPIKYRGWIDPKAILGTLAVSQQNGNWYAAVCGTVEKSAPKRLTNPIGIDVGLLTLATLSTGKKYENIRPQKSLQNRLTAAQQALSRRKKGSSRYNEARREIGRIYERTANIRRNHLHHVSRQIVDKKPSLIAVEDLNITGMMKSTLARSMGDASLRELTRQLEYKQTWNGGAFVKIDRYFPSSKTCSACGHINQDLPISVRKWKCICGKTHDRDINAAKNILRQSLAYSERRGNRLRSATLPRRDTNRESVVFLPKQDTT